MLLQLDPSATTYPDGPARLLERERVHVRVETCPDPVIDEVNYDHDQLIWRTFWLPVLGPSTITRAR